MENRREKKRPIKLCVTELVTDHLSKSVLEQLSNLFDGINQSDIDDDQAYAATELIDCTDDILDKISECNEDLLIGDYKSLRNRIKTFFSDLNEFEHMDEIRDIYEVFQEYMEELNELLERYDSVDYSDELDSLIDLICDYQGNYGGLDKMNIILSL